jgi:hypothetical protein
MMIRSGRLAGLAGVLFALSLLSVTQSAAAGIAAALGPEVSIAEPRDGFVGRLNVAPENGPAGTPLTINADRLPPNEEFQLIWRTVKGRWKVDNAEYHGRDYDPVAYQIAKLKSDAAGKLSHKFDAPEDFGFIHDIVLQQPDRMFTQVGFAIDMTIDISPKEGPVGTPITVDVKGIGWRSLFNSWELLYDNNFTGWISAVTTGGSAKFTIPATGRPGVHILEVLHGELTFPYRNMQQNPEPDRPRWAIPFTITPGPAVLPPAPESQAQTVVRRLPPPGELVATPAFSAILEPVVVSGGGFEPGKSYKLNWTRVIGNRMTGRGWEVSATPVAEATADAQGNATFQFKVPDDLGGEHGLFVDMGGGKKKEGAFWIKATAASLKVGRGPVGTEFRIHLKGVGWSETANIVHLVYDNSYIGYACAVNSQGVVELIMIATGEPGWHFIDLYPGIYKGQETRPNNFRIPQLTYADDHPGEDLPAFRYAFEVTADGKVGQLKPSSTVGLTQAR